MVFPASEGGEDFFLRKQKVESSKNLSSKQQKILVLQRVSSIIVSLALASCLSIRVTLKFTSQLSKVSKANTPIQFLA
jgi:hypothetical protein